MDFFFFLLEATTNVYIYIYILGQLYSPPLRFEGVMLNLKPEWKKYSSPLKLKKKLTPPPLVYIINEIF